MLRAAAAVATLLALAACAQGSAQPSGAVMAGPEVQAATATCEARRSAREIATLAQVAQCERDLALPQEQREQPDLAALFASLWSDKIELYGEVDQGRLTQAEADRKIAIRADNWLTNLRSVRRL